MSIVHGSPTLALPNVPSQGRRQIIYHCVTEINRRSFVVCR